MLLTTPNRTYTHKAPDMDVIVENHFADMSEHKDTTALTQEIEHLHGVIQNLICTVERKDEAIRQLKLELLHIAQARLRQHMIQPVVHAPHPGFIHSTDWH